MLAPPVSGFHDCLKEEKARKFNQIKRYKDQLGVIVDEGDLFDHGCIVPIGEDDHVKAGFGDIAKENVALFGEEFVFGIDDHQKGVLSRVDARHRLS